MSYSILFAVLIAALLHASWNAMVKNHSDKFISMSAMVYGSAFFGFFAILYAPTPPVETYPYMAAAVLLHVGYQIVLANAYKFGPLSVIYPISRGGAPMLVTLFSILFLGVGLTTTSIIGILTIIIAIFMLMITANHNHDYPKKAILFAILTAIFIASYSMVDGYGSKLSNNNSLGFYGYVTFLNGILFLIIMNIKDRNNIKTIIRNEKYVLFIGGGASFLAYAIVMWAFVHAPIAAVTSLRETSILFAMMIGVFVFKERLTMFKIIASLLAVIGVILIKIG